jgi:glycosyltransferase involved in cell wall biosynthesis
MKNVIIINDHGSVTGGAAKVAISNAIDLAQAGISVLFFCGTGPVDQRLYDSNCKVVCLEQVEALKNKNFLKGACQSVWNFKAKKMLATILQNYEISDTIIHVHGWTKTLSSSIFSCFKHESFRVVVSLQDYFLCCPNGGLYNYKKKEHCGKIPLSFNCIITNCDSRNFVFKILRVLRQFVQNKSIYRVRHLSFIKISEYSYNLLKPYLHGHQVSLVKNPIDKPFDINSETNSEPYFLYVGRVSPEKGVDIFCEACRSSNLKGVVVGDGPDRVNLSNDYPEVTFLGWSSGQIVSRHMSTALALVFPSRWPEPQGLVINEAHSYGLISIVSDDCAGADSIIDGYNGLLFLSGNSKSLREKMQYVKNNNNKVEQMNRNAIETYTKLQFEAMNIVEDLLNAYQKQD